MGWFLLALAIVLEVSGTTCMKFSDGFKELIPSVLVFVFCGLSFTAFVYGLKTIDLSISYSDMGWPGASFNNRYRYNILQRTGDYLKDGIYCAHTYWCDRLEFERSQGINGENRFTS